MSDDALKARVEAAAEAPPCVQPAVTVKATSPIDFSGDRKVADLCLLPVQISIAVSKCLVAGAIRGVAKGDPAAALEACLTAAGYYDS